MLRRGMMAAASGGGSDPMWGDVVLLINGVGAHDSSAIYDAKGHTVNNTGSIKISTADADFPGGAIHSPSGTGTYYLMIADSDDFTFTGDFTIEYDYKSVSRDSNYPTPLSLYNAYGANGGMAFFDRHTGSPSNYVAAINGGFPILATPSAGDGVKKRFRYVRESGTLSLYINDSLIGSVSNAGTRQAVGGVWIGRPGDSVSTGMNGYVGRIRITRAARTGPQGTAPYPEG